MKGAVVERLEWSSYSAMGEDDMDHRSWARAYERMAKRNTTGWRAEFNTVQLQPGSKLQMVQGQMLDDTEVEKTALGGVVEFQRRDQWGKAHLCDDANTQQANG